jgi:hypothetical protein
VVRATGYPSRRAQHVAAAAVIAAMAVVNLRGWLFQDIIPRQDFAGYAAVAQYVQDSVLRYGFVPDWCSKWFAGSSNFLSSLKEYVALPLVSLAGPVHGLIFTILLLKIAGPLALYAIFVRELEAPLAGLVAAYAYGFGPCANHATERLDVALSYVLVPLVLLAASDLARRPRAAMAALLGLLVACQLDVNYMQASVCVGMLLLLAVFRPWRAAAAPTGRATLLVATGASAFLVFAGSQIAWLVADGANHAFFSRAHLAFAQYRFSVYSPFFLLDRANWMGEWLAAHVPPGADPADEVDVFYLGAPVLLVSIVGWFAVRRRPTLRRWYQVGVALLLSQYAMSMGSRSFVWQLVASFQGSDAFAATLARIVLAAAVVVVIRGVLLLVRAREAPAHHRGELWLGAGIVLALAAYPLFDLVARTVPGVGGVRSPMKFFDLVPFSASLVFGVSLVGISGRISDVRRWHAVAIAVGLLVLVDFWPSARVFSEGTRPADLAELDAALRALPGENGTLRVLGMSSAGWLSVGPRVSLLLMNSDAGGARSWVPWQASPHWADFVATDLRPHRAERCLPWRPEVSCDFLAVARVKYVLDVPPAQPLERPWTLRAGSARFRLWERPDVMPMAYGTRAWVIFVGGSNDIGDAIDDAFPRVVVVSAGRSLRNLPADVLAGAAVIRYGDGTSREGEPAVPDAVASRIVGPIVGRNERWESLVHAAERPLLDVRYGRPGPEEIVLETDAGDGPAVIHVAESYHPWWTARVDGRPSAVVRAQRSFMGVVVGPGGHRVEFHFVPPLGVRLADGVTAIGWGFFGLAGIAWAAATLWQTVKGVDR